MANKVEIKINYKGVGALLKGKETEKMMSDFGSRIASQSGNEYSYRTVNSGQRIIANIFPATKKAAKDNLKNNTLLKALH